MEAREAAERYLAAANVHDIDGMTELWESGGIENFATFGQRYRVPEGFVEHLHSLFSAFPDLHWEIISITTDGELAAVRSRMRGTHLGRYQGMAATGKRLTVETVDFLCIRNGKIVQNDVFFDGLTSLRQVGALPPTGSRRERALQRGFNLLVWMTRPFRAGKRI